MLMKTMKIKGNTVMAVIDGILKKKGLEPIYILEEFLNTETNELEKGLILNDIKEVDSSNFSGILVFVNGEEPSEGSVAIDEMEIKVGDEVSMAFVKQGVYKGDFKHSKEKAIGLDVVLLDYKVKEENLKEEIIVQVLEESTKKILCPKKD